MPLWMIPMLIAGLGLAATLIGIYGASDIGTAFLSAGWGVAIVVVCRLVQVCGAGACWAVITPAPPRLPLTTFLKLRLVREAINVLLPVAQIGGDLIGGRLITFYGSSGAAAAASVIVDIFLQVSTQFLFTLMGLGVLLWLGGASQIAEWVGSGLLIAAPVLIAFFLAQGSGSIRRLEKALAWIAAQGNWGQLAGLGDLGAALQGIYRRKSAVFGGFAIHMVTWIFGTCEVWIALHFIGYPVTFAQALAIESLSQAVRGAAFVVPGAYGVQEGGLIALCGLFGVSPQAAIALSLVKRVPDLVLGLPGLLLWSTIEGRQRSRKGALADQRA